MLTISILSLSRFTPPSCLRMLYFFNYDPHLSVEVYTTITSNEYEDELPMKRCDLPQSQSNLHCTIWFFRSVLSLLF